MRLTFSNLIASGWLRAAFLVTIVIAVSPLRAQRICTVPGTYSDLQSAINDWSCWNVMLGAGTYYGNFTIPQGRNMNITGAGAGVTTVDGQEFGPVFSIASASVHLEGMTIQNGAYGPGFVGFGGVVSLGGNLTIVNSVITQNFGGVEYSGSGVVTIADSTVSSNSTEQAGVIEMDSGTLYLIRSAVVRATSTQDSRRFEE